MPGATAAEPGEGERAISTIMDNLERMKETVQAQNTDLLFLRNMMESKGIQNLVKAHDRLEDLELTPVQTKSTELLGEVMENIEPLIASSNNAAELAGILQDLNFLSLMESHDLVAAKSYDRNSYPALEGQPLSSYNPTGQAIRMVGVRKTDSEPLGITLKIEDGDVVISRILQGGMIDKQGLLNVGDVIKEINGRDVTNDPEALQEEMKNSVGGIMLKIVPSYQDVVAPAPGYMKAHFSFDASKDKLIPCREAGLSFKCGDILQIVEKEDANWWQAAIVGSEHSAGLIPSQELQERRQAFVPKPNNSKGNKKKIKDIFMTKKKKAQIYSTKKNYEFDQNDIPIYEEVERMPPFQRRTLVLIGAQGVGRTTLKNRLLNSGHAFGAALASTSRTQRDTEIDGEDYIFCGRLKMEEDIHNNKYLEYGDYEGNLYGTLIDSVKKVIQDNKMCVLDVNPQALKALRTSEFLPFIVFVKSPDFKTLKDMHRESEKAGLSSKQVTDSDLRKTVEESSRLESNYKHLFDLIIENNNIDESYNKLLNALENLTKYHQWVPVSWVYDQY
ncbi:MAGUK p55 subfamily member 6-like isoform X2 [Anneissia japonica]|uniref:MAGUK p55 subfamily member 6-like isoform X2 n=1 Tax=Anneissia japonica TaxID=1529436 RepID=UPI001425A188|nr:MAGUK p55 subfamily member 6-like isoform X2 [Anneissia japonica]